ncbi:MAG: TIGR03067 domain-containing protein [Bacteroidia bacterium]
MNRPKKRYYFIFYAALVLLSGCVGKHQVGDELNGEWQLLHVEADGEVYPDDRKKDIHVRINDQGFKVIREGQYPIFLGKFLHEEMFYPKHLDIWLAGDDDAGIKRKGIYRLKGDTLEACFSPPGAYRPAYFETRRGSKQILSIWVRIKNK